MANKPETTKDVEDVDIYKMFGSDESKEQDGILLNYSDVFWLRVARAGGANKRYQKILTDITRPYRRAIQTETILPEMTLKLLRQATAEGVVLNWGSAKFGDGVMPDQDGKPMEFSVDNVVKFFTLLPGIFEDVQEQAGKISLFRATETEDDAKN